MAQWNRDTPWRQGHILSAASAKALGLTHPDAPDDSIVVVVSHDCDLAQLPDAEPLCEIVIGKPVGDLNGNNTAAKNPRRLHLPSTGAEVSVRGEFDARRKTTVAKAALADHQPAENVRLTTDERTILQSWLSARYRRAAFPDVFDRRLKDGKGKFFDKFANIIKKTGAHLLAVYFDISPDEEAPADQTYDLSIDLVYSVADDPVKSHAAATEAVAGIKDLFAKTYCDAGKWEGIELKDCWPTSADAMTVHQARLLKQWHFEYLSLRDDPQGETVAIP